MPTPTNYVPPAKRAAPALRTEKKALKKEFSIEQAAFPSLGDTIKKSATRGTPISFSSAAAKKVETPTEKKVEVLPGWVHIRHCQGKIQYKYGDPIIRDAEEERADQIRSRIILKNRIAREEYDRARNIERLGDLSEFYEEPTLAEIYENDVESESDTDETDEDSE
jgi:hypothetical protein